MSVAVIVKDETGAGKCLQEQVLHFPLEQISVRQLIEQRVSSEVERYNQSTSQPFYGLVQPKDAEERLNGPRAKGRKPVDAEQQKSIAIEAFESNGFFLLVNDRQLTDLDEVIKITPKTSVVFIKLIPLVGG